MALTFKAGTGFVLIVSLLLGCTGGSGGKSSSSQARTLRVSEALSGTLLGDESSTDWSLRDVRKINVRACLQDSVLVESVGRARWWVEGTGPRQEVTSDWEGCISWLETVDFEPTSAPRYITIQRRILSAKGDFEPLPIRFLINPWSGWIGDEPLLVDPNFESPRLSAGTAIPGRIAMSLVAHGIKTTPSLTLDLRFSALIMTRAMDGSQVTREVESGRVRVRAQILYRASAGATARAVLPEVNLASVSFANGVVDLQSLPLAGLPALQRSQGRFLLRLQVEPLDAPRGLGGFYGDVDLGDWNGLHSGQGLGVSSANLSSAEVAGALPSEPEFVLGLVRGRTYGPVDENTLLRRVQLSLSVTVQGTAFAESLEGDLFTATALESGSPTLYSLTVKEGKLSWQDVVVHNYYQVMTKPLQRNIVFTHAKTGRKVTKSLDLTPWVNFFIAAVDTDRLNVGATGLVVPVSGAMDRRPQVRLESPCMSQGDVRYAVDPATLALRVNMQPFFRFAPRVRRYDDPLFGNATFDAPGLRPGYYQLTLAVFNLDRAEWERPVAVAQKVVTVLGGNLSMQMKLQSRELSLLRLRNYVVAQVDFLDPSTLTPTADGGMTGRVMPSEELNLSQPVNVFPLVFSENSCATSPATESLSNPRVQALSRQIRDKKLDLLSLARQARRDQSTTEPFGVRDPGNWRAAAQSWGMEPLELAQAADAQKLGYARATDLKTVIEGLECAYMIGEASAKMPAKCSYENYEPLSVLCNAIAVKWADLLTQAVAAGPSVRGQRPSAMARLFYRACYKRDPKSRLQVRKYMQIGELAGAEDVQVLRGSPAFDINLKDSFMLGTDDSSSVMNERRTSLTGTVRVFAAVPEGGPSVISAVGRGTAKPLVKEQASFKMVFSADGTNQTAGLTSSTSLTMETMDVRLQVRRHRVCYTVEPVVDVDLWASLRLRMTYAEAPKPRLYVCFSESREALDISERYFVVYNNVESNAALVDSARAANRWLLNFRGERDFAVFALNLRAHIKNIYRGQSEVIGSVATVIDSARKEALMDQTMFPGVVQAPAPGRENYDSISNLEGFLPKVVRWLSETFNPFETYE